MLAINSLFDDYGLRARLLPTLLVVVPAAIVVALLFPTIYATYARVFGSLGFSAIALFFLAHVIRGKGRALQDRLHAEWDGIPTTAWLRHRDRHLDQITKARYHKFLEKHIPDLKMPSADEERDDPKAADHVYRSAVKWLLEYTRDTKEFPLVFAENVYYGFRRNTLAAKSLALFVLFILILLTALVAYSRHGFIIEQIDPDIIASLSIAIIAAVAWILLVTTAWVRDGSNAYARALLASCDKV